MPMRLCRWKKCQGVLWIGRDCLPTTPTIPHLPLPDTLYALCPLLSTWHSSLHKPLFLYRLIVGLPTRYLRNLLRLLFILPCGSAPDRAAPAYGRTKHQEKGNTIITEIITRIPILKGTPIPIGIRCRFIWNPHSSGFILILFVASGTELVIYCIKKGGKRSGSSVISHVKNKAE